MGLIAQANASAIYFQKETTWGSQAAGNYNTLRLTGGNPVTQRTGTIVSNELRVSREPGQVIRTEVSAEGNFNFELALGLASTAFAGTLGYFVESVMGAVAQTEVFATSALFAVTTVGAGVAHISGTSAFNSISVGDWVAFRGFTSTAANDGAFYVSAKTSSSDITIVNAAAVAQAAGPTVTAAYQRYAAGPNLISLSMEQKVPTNQPLYRQAFGMVVRSFTVEAAPGSILTGSVQLVGRSCATSTASISGTVVPADTSYVKNSIDGISAIYETTMGTAETWSVSRFSLTVDSEVTARTAIGSAFAVGVRIGQVSAKGTMRIFAEHTSGETGGVLDILNAYESGTKRNGLAVLVKDVASQAQPVWLVWMFQDFFITNASVPIGGNNEDLFLDLEFMAQVDAAAVNGPSGAPTAFTMHYLDLN